MKPVEIVLLVGVLWILYKSLSESKATISNAPIGATSLLPSDTAPIGGGLSKEGLVFMETAK